MKTKMLTILGVVAAMHLVFLGVISLSGGCRHPEVLKERPNVPPPALLPPDEGQPAPVIERQEIIKETIIEKPAPEILPPPVINKTTPPPPDKKHVEKTKAKSESLSYTVKSGDSFWTIARNYGVSVGELAAANNVSIEKAKSLKVGTVLTIPPGGAPVPKDKLPKIQPKHEEKSSSSAKTSSSTAAKSKSSSKKEAVPADGTYVVKNGDSIWKIAAKFGVSSKDIVSANKLDPAKHLQLGQKIVIPSGKGSEKSSTQPAKTEAKAPEKTGEVTLDDISSTPPKSAAPQDAGELEAMLNVPAPAKADGAQAGGAIAPDAADVVPASPALEPTATVIDTTEIVETPSGSVTFIDHECLTGETPESVSNIYGCTVEDLIVSNTGLRRGVKIPAKTKLKVPRTK